MCNLRPRWSHPSCCAHAIDPLIGFPRHDGRNAAPLGERRYSSLPERQHLALPGATGDNRRRDRPAPALARARREARLRGAAHLRRRALHRRIPRSWRASTSRSSARRRTTSSPTGRAPASGRARSAPPSCPPGPHLEAKIDAFAELRIVDYGDAPVMPADPARRTPRSSARRRGASTRARSRSCSAATTRSPSPTSAPSPRGRGPVGLVHFDTHTDTGREVFGVEISHGTPMFRLVEAGQSTRSATSRSACAATGRASASSRWQAERGITSFFMHDVRELGIEEVVGRTLAIVGDGPVSFRRRRRARSGLRARNGHARARRDDERRPALGVPRGRAAGSRSSAPTWSRCSRPRSARWTSPRSSPSGSSARS